MKRVLNILVATLVFLVAMSTLIVVACRIYAARDLESLEEPVGFVTNAPSLGLIPADKGLRDGRRQFVLLSDSVFVFRRKNRLVVMSIPARFVTDFASTPIFAWPVFEPIGRYAEAAVVHDWMYAIGSGAQEEKVAAQRRKEADMLFYYSMKQSGIDRKARDLIYTAVRVFGARAYGNEDEWRRRFYDPYSETFLTPESQCLPARPKSVEEISLPGDVDSSVSQLLDSRESVFSPALKMLSASVAMMAQIRALAPAEEQGKIDFLITEWKLFIDKAQMQVIEEPRAFRKAALATFAWNQPWKAAFGNEICQDFLLEKKIDAVAAKFQMVAPKGPDPLVQLKAKSSEALDSIIALIYKADPDDQTKYAYVKPLVAKTKAETLEEIDTAIRSNAWANLAKSVRVYIRVEASQENKNNITAAAILRALDRESLKDQANETDSYRSNSSTGLQ